MPEEWIAQVDVATLADPYTNNKRTVDQTVDGLYAAFQARQQRLRDYVSMMKAAT
jgi:hypothetical protein